MSGWNIHSHPQQFSYHVNSVDKAFLHQELRRHPIIGTQPDQFSPDDFRFEHGYMVGAT